MRVLRKRDTVLREANNRLDITVTGRTATDAAKNLETTYNQNKDVINMAQGQGKDVDITWQNGNASKAMSDGGSNTSAQAKPTQGSGLASAKNALIDAAADTDNKLNVSVDASDIKGEGVILTKAQLNEMLIRLRKK